MNEDELDQTIRRFLHAEVKKVEPSSAWWDNAIVVSKSSKQLSKTTDKSTRKWRLHPSLIGIPLSIVLLITIAGGLLAGMGGMSPPPPAAPITISDGASGAFLVWYDQPYHQYQAMIRAQHIDENGNLLWGTEDVQITGNRVGAPQVVSDGGGGLIIAWNDNEGINITRIDPDGNTVWRLDNFSSGSLLATIEDKSGGALLLFSQSDILQALKISHEGLFSWEQEGVVVSTAEYPCYGVSVAEDGYGGMIIVWQNRLDTGVCILAQRISSQGEILWADEGVILTTSNNDYGNNSYTQVITDGMGDAFIAWDTESAISGAPASNVYIQKLDGDGNKQWGEEGILVCQDHETDSYSPANMQSHPKVASDSTGGVIVTWHDRRRIFNREIFAQRISADGKIMWDANGVWLWDIPEDYPKTSGILGSSIIADGTGGTIVVWTGHEEHRNYTTYIQKLSHDGERQWPNEIVYSNPVFQSQGYSSIASDGKGGVIVVSRAGEGSSLSQTDSVYTQRIGADGTQVWHESGVEIHKVHSAPTLYIIFSGAILALILVFIGLFYKNKLARVSSVMLPVILGVAGLFGVLLVIGPFGYSYAWAYIPDSTCSKVMAISIAIAGLFIGIAGIKENTITRWILLPVTIFCLLVTAIAGMVFFL